MVEVSALGMSDRMVRSGEEGLPELKGPGEGFFVGGYDADACVESVFVYGYY